MGVTLADQYKSLFVYAFNIMTFAVVRLDLGTSRFHIGDLDVASTTFTRFYKH
jgi:hypothetical protein